MLYTISINISTLVARLLLLAAVLLLLFTAFRGLAFPDEGYIVNTGQRVLDGQVLYKDFDFVYTPITSFAAAASFLILGSSIFAERVIALLVSLITFYFLIRLGKLLTTHHLLQLLPSLLYVTWGPSHINFIWPGMWAVNFAIIGFCLLFEAIQKKNNNYFLYSGIFVSLVVMTKQNFAVAILVNLLLLILLLKLLQNKLRQIYLWLGIVFPFSLFLIYTFFMDSTWAFLQNSYVHVIQQVLIQGSINTPLLVGSNLIFALGKLLFYFSPLFLSLFAAVVVWKGDKTKLILVTFVAIFFLFGFRPVTDYVHLSPLLSLTGIPLLLLILHFKRHPTILYLIPNTLFIILLLVGLWSALFFGYYRWSPPLITQNALTNHPRVGIWTDTQTKQQIETVSALLNAHSKPGEEVFLNYYAPMVFFLTGRRNPTRFDYTGLPEEYQKQVVQTLEQKKINTVVTFYLNKNDKSIIGEFIKNNYFFTKKSGEYEVWRRK